MILGDAAEAIAQALTGVGIPVHTVPPGALTGSAIVVSPGRPWLTQISAGLWQAVFEVTIFVDDVQGWRVLAIHAEAAHRLASTTCLTGALDSVSVHRDQGLISTFFEATITMEV